MTTIPEMCMQYTELFVALTVGVLIGYWVRRLGE